MNSQENLQEKLQAQKKEMVRRTQKLSEYYQTNFVSERLQILRPLLKWEAILAAATNIPPGLVPLFIGLKQILINKDDPKSPTQLMGPELNKLVSSLTEHLSSLWEPSITDSHKDFFKELITFSLISSTCFGAFFSKEETSLNTKKEELHHFSYQLTLLSLINSSLMQRTFQSFAKFCDANKQTQQAVGEFLSLVVWLFLLFVTVDQNSKKAASLIETIKNPAISHLNRIDQLLSQVEETPQNPIIFVQKCKKSFENEDIHGIMECIEGVLEIIDVSFSHLKEELRSLYKITSLIEMTLTQGIDDKTNTSTGISIVV